MPPAPNILILVSHDTGRYVSPYGVATVATPTFERLAREGVQFDQAFSTAPQCSPARAALFSGCYPHAVGVLGNVGREHGWRFSDESRHAARIFGEAGYATWMLGLLHETWRPETLGFDHIDTSFGSILEAGGSLDAMLAERDTERPFYCQIGCKETHRPWDFGDEPSSDSLRVTVPPHLDAGPATVADMAQMQGSVERLDRGVGEILDVLDRHGVADDTILVVTTDHGLAVVGAKGFLTDAGLGVFLFMRWPAGGWPGGDRCDELVSHVDILPTLLTAIGREPEPQMQGQSVLPLLAPSADSPAGWRPREAVFGEKTWFHTYDPMRVVRTRDRAFIQNFEFSRQTEMLLDYIDAGSTSENWRHFAGGHRGDCELYDLTMSPLQTAGEDLAASRPEEVTMYRRQLYAWMEETADPLLRGAVSSPYFERVMTTMSPPVP